MALKNSQTDLLKKKKILKNYPLNDFYTHIIDNEYIINNIEELSDENQSENENENEIYNYKRNEKCNEKEDTKENNEEEYNKNILNNYEYENYKREIFNNHIMKILYTKPSKKYKMIETIHPITSKFIMNIKDYLFNNTINYEHVNEIYKQILNDDDKEIIGNFTVIQCDDNNNIYLLDGHHRKTALLKIINENNDRFYFDNNNITIEIKLYHVPNLESHLVEELYNKINNVKPFTIKTKDDKVRIIMSKLNEVEAFKKGLHSYKNNNVIGCAPYYNINKFINQLRELINNNEYDYLDNLDIIVNRIIDFNTKCSKLKLNKLFGLPKDSKANTTNYKKKLLKMKTINFYLCSTYGKTWIKRAFT